MNELVPPEGVMRTLHPWMGVIFIASLVAIVAQRLGSPYPLIGMLSVVILETLITGSAMTPIHIMAVLVISASCFWTLRVNVPGNDFIMAVAHILSFAVWIEWMGTRTSPETFTLVYDIALWYILPVCLIVSPLLIKRVRERASN